MNRVAKILLELTGMALLVFSLCLIPFVLMYFVHKAEIANQKPNPFAHLVKNEDVQVDKSGNVRYKGELLGNLQGLEPEPQLALPNLPNGVENPQTLYLGKGTWLISGGNIESESKSDHTLECRTSTENYLFHERTKQFQSLPPLSKGRWLHSLLKLANGSVLIFGGYFTNGNEATIELLDMKRNCCTTIGQSTQGRIRTSLLEVAPGSVLAVGGSDPETTIVELISVDRCACTTLGHLNKTRWGASIFHISDNDYLVVGGYNSLSEDDSNHLPPELISVPEGKP